MYLEHWHELIEKWADSPESSRSRVLDEVLNGKGVPAEVRSALWLVSTGAKRKKRMFPTRYRECRDKENKTSHVIAAISRDVRRTFPIFKANIPRFERLQHSSSSTVSTVMNGSKPSTTYAPHELALFNVLAALSVAMPDIGYHQGLNFVVAMLLITLRPVNKRESTTNAKTSQNQNQNRDSSWRAAEEDAFWVALSLLNDYHMAGLYHSYSSFLQQFVDQFDTLFRRFLPRLHRHLSLHLDPKLEPVLFAVDWFTTLFTYSLRFDAALIVWDCFLAARLDEALYVTGLALLLKLAEAEDDKSLGHTDSFGDAMERFRDLKHISASELQVFLRHVVERLVPSTLMPPGHSTLFRIERELQDPSNPYTTQHYGASQLVRCVQLGKMAEVQHEVLKYSFPASMLEYTLVRATALGDPAVVDVLISAAGCSPDCRATLKGEGITPLHLSALLGHATVARVLLARGASPDIKCTASLILRYFRSENGMTALQLAQAVAAKCGNRFSAVEAVLSSNVCIGCGLFLKRVTEAEASFMSSLFGFEPAEAVERGGDVGHLSFCATCYESEKITDNRRRLEWQKARNIELDKPLGPLSWSCRHCKTGLIGDRKVTCKRCMFSYCLTCAFTFRTLRSRNPAKLVRVCQNCHHLLRSCPCVNMKTPSSRGNAGEPEHVKTPSANGRVHHPVYCRHMPYDYSDALHSSLDVPSEALKPYCDCYHCSEQRYRVMEPIVSSRIAKYKSKGQNSSKRTSEMFTAEEAFLRGYAVDSFSSDSPSVSASGLNPVEQARAELLILIENLYSWVQKAIERSISKQKKPAINESNSVTTPSPAEPTMEGTARDYAGELKQFYEKWNPSKLSSVGELLERFEGKEEELLDNLKKSYGLT